MEARDLKAAELARLLKLGRSAVSRALTTNSGLDRHWVKIALFLDVSLDWLLTGSARQWPIEFLNDESRMQDGRFPFEYTQMSVVGRVELKPSKPWYSEIGNAKICLDTTESVLEVSPDPNIPFLQYGGYLVIQRDLHEHFPGEHEMPEVNNYVVLQTISGETIMGRFGIDSRNGHYIIYSFLIGKDPQVVTKKETRFLKIIRAFLPRDSKVNS